MLDSTLLPEGGLFAPAVADALKTAALRAGGNRWQAGALLGDRRVLLQHRAPSGTARALAQRRQVKPRRRAAIVGPARGNRLAAGVEAHPVHAVHVQVAEQRIAPTAE